ncbi:hypothetical protein [Williamsia soli]|uniref:hypothetical protein n=1 Tax=Williamsia soli TaxID=364929 RepID=UPI001A9DB1DD|nr:hypothetical protein [Williamsia soli]
MTEQQEFTASDIIAKVREVAARNPGRIYEVPMGGERYYVYDGMPASLEGCALWEMGLIDVSLQARWVNELSIRDLLNTLKVNGTDDEINWLRWSQHYGDHLDPWGTAVEKADECLANGIEYRVAS